MRKRWKSLLILVVIVLASCGPSVGDNAPGEETLRGEVYISEAQLIIMESYPIQVAITLRGDLPTPCHSLKYQYEVQAFPELKRIDVNVYSQAEADAVCVQMLQPFEENLGLDMQGAAEGLYALYLNGEWLGEFSYPG